jgi:hypothetical protein
MTNVLSTSGSPEANAVNASMTSRLRGLIYRHHRLRRTVEGGGVDLGVVAADHAAPCQGPDPLQARRRRDAQRAGQLPVGLPRVGLQEADDLRVEVVHGIDPRKATGSVPRAGRGEAGPDEVL